MQNNELKTFAQSRPGGEKAEGTQDHARRGSLSDPQCAGAELQTDRRQYTKYGGSGRSEILCRLPGGWPDIQHGAQRQILRAEILSELPLHSRMEAYPYIHIYISIQIYIFSAYIELGETRSVP